MIAKSAERALELVSRRDFDLIILDINLPGMNGFEALEKLRENPKTREIPALALSASAMPDDIAAGHKAGFRRYLTKPINIKDVLEAIHGEIGVTNK